MKKILVMMLMVAFATLSHAQSLTKGEIFGYVTDDSGSALPGVSIQISSDSLQGTRSTVTNANGFYRFPLLPKGKYKVVFSLNGFQTVTAQNVASKIGEKTSQDIVLKTESLQEAIIVTAEAPLVDTSTADSSMELDAETLTSIPTLARSVEDVAKFTPGVTGVSINTNSGSTDGLPSMRGSGMEGNQYVVDGVSARGSMTFDNAIAQNYDSIENLIVVADPYSPEYGKAQGGAINVVTKSGGNEFHGEFGLQYRNAGLESSRLPVVTDNPVTGFDRTKQWYNLGGPIIKDKLWFFVSYNYNKSTNQQVAADPKIIDADDYSIVTPDGTPYGSDVIWYEYQDGESVTVNEKLFAKLTYRIMEGHDLSFSYLDGSVENANTTGVQELWGTFISDQERWRVNYSWLMGDFGVLEVKYGKQELYNINTGPTDPSIAQRFNEDISWAYGNRGRDRNIIGEDREDWAIKLTAFWDSMDWGTHEFTMGFEKEEYSTVFEIYHTGYGEDLWPNNIFNGGVSYNFRFATMNDLYGDGNDSIVYFPGEGLRELPVTVEESSNSVNFNTVKGNGFFFQDRINYNDWTFMIGLRADAQDYYNDIGEKVLDWGMSEFLVPRFTAIYDLNGDQKHIFKFAYGQFKDAASTRLLEWFNTQGGNAFRQYEWIGPVDRAITDADLHNPDYWGFIHEQSADSNALDMDPDIEPEVVTRYSLEYNYRINPRHAFVARYTKSITDNMIEDVAFFNEDPSGVGDFDGPYNWTWLIMNFDEKRRDYQSIDLEFKGKFSDFLDYSLTYTWAQAYGTNVGNFELPSYTSDSGSGHFVGIFGDHAFDISGGENYYLDLYDWYFSGLGGIGDDEGWYGRLTDVPQHTVNFIGNFHLPKGVEIATTVQWVSGFYWAKKGYNPAYGDYVTFPEGRGSRKTSSMFFWDMSIFKKFTVWYDHSFELRLDIFNVLNSQKPITYIGADTGDFGKPWARQDPRAIQLGVSYKF